MEINERKKKKGKKVEIKERKSNGKIEIKK